MNYMFVVYQSQSLTGKLILFCRVIRFGSLHTLLETEIYTSAQQSYELMIDTMEIKSKFNRVLLINRFIRQFLFDIFIG